jgi:hypothetical protein
MEDCLNGGKMSNPTFNFPQSIMTQLKFSYLRDSRMFSTLGMCIRNIISCLPVLISNRWLHTRVLLFRPLFSHAFHSRDSLLEEDNSSLDTQVKSLVASHCLVMCVRAAQQIIELIHNTLMNEKRWHTLPPPWYNITCTII